MHAGADVVVAGDAVDEHVERHLLRHRVADAGAVLGPGRVVAGRGNEGADAGDAVIRSLCRLKP